MRSEKFPHQSHVLFEGHAANQVAGVLKVHHPDIWLRRCYFANHWLCTRYRKGPGMFHDQSRTGHLLQKFSRVVLVCAVPELYAVPCEMPMMRGRSSLRDRIIPAASSTRSVLENPLAMPSERPCPRASTMMTS